MNPLTLWYGSDEDALIADLVADAGNVARSVFMSGKRKGEGNLWRAIMDENHDEHIRAHMEKYLAGDTSEDHVDHIAARRVMREKKREWLRAMGEVTLADIIDGEEYSPNTFATL